jgi:hypothetical protein
LTRRSELVSAITIGLRILEASFYFSHTLFLATGHFAVEQDGIVAGPVHSSGIPEAFQIEFEANLDV